MYKFCSNIIQSFAFNSIDENFNAVAIRDLWYVLCGYFAFISHHKNPEVASVFIWNTNNVVIIQLLLLSHHQKEYFGWLPLNRKMLLVRHSEMDMLVFWIMYCHSQIMTRLKLTSSSHASIDVFVLLLFVFCWRCTREVRHYLRHIFGRMRWKWTRTS